LSIYNEKPEQYHIILITDGYREFNSSITSQTNQKRSIVAVWTPTGWAWRTSSGTPITNQSFWVNKQTIDQLVSQTNAEYISINSRSETTKIWRQQWTNPFWRSEIWLLIFISMLIIL
jgi:hypothetical protein